MPQGATFVEIDSAEAAQRFLEFTFNAYRDDLKNFDPARSLAIGLCVEGVPAGLVLIFREKSKYAQLRSIFVNRAWRRRSLAFALLTRVEQRLAEDGVETIEISYRSGLEATPALEALLSKSGWPEPRARQLYCRSNGRKIRGAKWLQKMDLPPEYEIISWSEVTDVDRASIRARQAAQPFYPQSLDPMRQEVGCEPLNSLGLRYRGEIVGWFITHPLGNGCVRYTCSFLRPDLQRAGRLVALYIEAMKRHIARDGLDASGVWTVPVDIPRMADFIRRRVAPFLLELAEFRVSRKELHVRSEVRK